ncbi:MAG: type II toxin-antitoxin system RelE/ParE family toxin [bacterium]
MTGYRYHPEARAEYQAAIAWYRARSRDAARGLANAVDEGLHSIRERPLAWPIWRGGPVRRRVLRRFPYSLFFSLNDNMVVILAVAHHSRRPGYWVHRAK